MEPVELNETTPKRKRYLRSKWWKYFTHEEIANKITIICNSGCSFSKTYDKNDFRTNYLQDNIKDKHKVIFADMNSAKEIRVFSEEEINRIQVDTVMWIINDNRPLSMIETPHFKKMMMNFEPNWTPFCYNTFKNVVIKIKGEIFQNVLQLLQKYNFFSQGSDGWKSKNKKNFYGVNIDFISDDWEMLDVNLDVIPIDEPHITAEIL